MSPPPLPCPSLPISAVAGLRLLRLLVVPFLLLASAQFADAWTRNAPPQLLPLEGHQSPIRIAVGTRGFKLSCPVRVDSEEEEAATGNGGESEELLIKWSKDGQPLNTGDPRFRLSSGDRDLRIRVAQLGDGGLYRCTAINEWGHRSVDFRLELLEPGKEGTAAEGVELAESASAPAWLEPLGPQPMHLRVQAGKTLQLRCPPAKANPLAKLSWLHGGQELASTALLSLGQVRPQDGGLFSCRLQNPLGQIRADFLVQVLTNEVRQEDIDGDDSSLATFGAIAEGAELLGPSGSLSAAGSASSLAALPPPAAPRIEQPPQKVRAGHTAELQCRVEWRGDRDRAVIRWLRQVETAEVDALRARMPNATLLRLGQVWLLMLDQHGQETARLETDRDGQRHFLNELRLSNVRKKDSGRYFCVVTNPAGQFVYRSALLSVVDDPSGPLGLPPSRLALLVALGCLCLCCLPALCWLLCLRLCRHHQPLAMAPTAGSSQSANNTFASSSSTASATTKPPAPLLTSVAAFLPPPPRVPPPQLPPSASFSSPQVVRHQPPFPLLGPDGNIWSNQTLDRRPPVERPPLLHRTTRAEDEMSRLSSHIYASGSPLPPAHGLHHQAHTPLYPTICSPPPPLPNHGQMHQQQQQTPSAARLPPNTWRKPERRPNRKAMPGEEQKMPLIEAQRQSAELWRGNY